MPTVSAILLSSFDTLIIPLIFFFIIIVDLEVPTVAQWVKNLTSIRKDAGLISRLPQWV